MKEAALQSRTMGILATGMAHLFNERMTVILNRLEAPENHADIEEAVRCCQEITDTLIQLSERLRSE